MLYLKDVNRDDLSPMMKGYYDTKKEHPDELVFYQLGDFYEMFFDDAIKASSVLDLTLTGRDCGLSERAPMCGLPIHAVESYLTYNEAIFKYSLGYVPEFVYEEYRKHIARFN